MHIPHTYRKHTGTYYARFSLPRRFYPTRDIRLSLQTKSPTAAKQRVYSLANHWHSLTCSDDFDSYNNPHQIKSELLTMWEREEEERKQRDKRVKTTKKRVKHNPFKPPIAQPVDFSKIINKIEAPDGTVFDTGNADKDLELYIKYKQLTEDDKTTKAVTGITLTELVKIFTKEKVDNKSWENPKTYSQLSGRLNKICKLAPNKPVNGYTRDNAINVREAILNIQFRGETIEATTASKYLKLLIEAINFGNTQQLISTTVFNDLIIKGKTKNKGTLTDHHFEAIFNGYIYKNIAPPSNVSPKVIYSYMFWIPLICAYTGFRIGEAAGLQVQDINQCPISKVYYFKIRDSKTENGKREVPIHNAILSAGFMDFYQERKKLGITAMLFDGITYNTSNKWAKSPSDWFNSNLPWEGYLVNCIGAKPKGWGTHMFRHTITDYMRNKLDLGDDRIAITLGHSSKTVTGNYGGKTVIENKSILLNRVVFNVNLDHVKWCDFEQYMNDFNNK
ncbi:tyrosine-type recombinase/integrase [Nitrincola schmidtii]|uniref:tyrosine-type recombinase/integrase n=1 Tax=Nitrincola schmidtii TaxID=1730894 RepID=UPI00124E3123|nr:tyrosine-type recombinase/integrase [Nitrincola schmidtii]